MSTETAEMRIYPVPSARPRPPVDLPDRSVRAIVIDAHAPSRIGTAVLLRNQSWVSRCFLAANVEESLRLVAEYRPDVALLDVSETGPFAGPVTARIRAAHPGVEIVLSSRCKASLGAPLADLGAVGFLPAGSATETILATVRRALLDGEGARAEEAAEEAGSIAAATELSDREREILTLLGTGATNREIAAHLHLGPDSVKKTATGLYRKLGVRNRTEAARRAGEVLR
jgi:DNA-binding NarL/FixJ family response regulator